MIVVLTNLKLTLYSTILEGKWGWRKLSNRIGGSKKRMCLYTVCLHGHKGFMSDQHYGIAKWIKECQVDCLHFFDVWHIAFWIIKAILEMGKENGCERISDWLKGAQNHLYMCATCTGQGLGELTMAKWKSFMRHVANKHEDHPSLFKQCAHEKEIESRRWIKINCEMRYFFHCLCTGLLALCWQHSFHCAKCCYHVSTLPIFIVVIFFTYKEFVVGILQRSFSGNSLPLRISSHLLCLLLCHLHGKLLVIHRSWGTVSQMRNKHISPSWIQHESELWSCCLETKNVRDVKLLCGVMVQTIRYIQEQIDTACLQPPIKHTWSTHCTLCMRQDYKFAPSLH